MPLHELDELKANYPNVVDLSADDLFLISKVSAYSTDDNNAITVSKKLSYKNMIEKISADFEIQKIKSDIIYLSGRVDNLSSNLRTTSSLLCTAIDTTSTLLSNTIDLSVNSLSATVDENFIQKYGSKNYNLISTGFLSDYVIYDGNVSVGTTCVLTASLAKAITIEDGQITNIEPIDIDNVFSLRNKNIAAGVIYGDTYNTKIVTSNGQLTSTDYTTLSACYLDVSLSVLESDASQAPLELGIIDVSNSFKKIAQFNNPGGFRGKTYWNYYHASAPVAANTHLRLRYADGSAVASTSKLQFIEYKWYAVAGEAELSRFMQRPITPVTTDGSLAFYKIQINSDGVITNAQKYDFDKATTTSLGLVKLKSTSDNNYGLQADASGAAYVTVPVATSTVAGTVKVGASSSTTSTGRTIGVTINTSSQLEAKVNYATITDPGVVKLGSSDDAANRKFHVGQNSSHQLQVTLPIASTTSFGLIKSGNKPNNGGTETPVYIDNGVAKVQYISAPNLTTSQKTSLLDTDKILVNHTSTNLQNYITFGNLKNSMMQVVPAGSTWILVKSVPKQTDAQYTSCTYTATKSTYYRFKVIRNGSDGDLWNSGACFCLVSVNGVIVMSANCSYWNATYYVGAGSIIQLYAYTSNSETSNASGERNIYMMN